MSAKSNRAIYPGSFDPITLGHIDLIQRLSSRYDEIIILVADNTSKSSLFTAEERKELIEHCLQSVKNIRVELFSGLTVDYAKKSKAHTIIRGLRAISDFESEYAMANMNRRLAPEVETLIVFTSPQYSYVSSRMVKEVASFGGNLKDIVPAIVAKALEKKMKMRSL